MVSGALEATSTAGHVVTGLFLTLFSAYFFLAQGDQIWAFLVRLLPKPAQVPFDEAMRHGWVTLTAFVRATIVVAFTDAVGIGLGAALLGVPLAVPLGVLVFIGAFIPVIGALISGSVAVLIALVAVGPVKALLMLGVVILVQQARVARAAAVPARPCRERAPAGRHPRHRHRRPVRRHHRRALRRAAHRRRQHGGAVAGRPHPRAAPAAGLAGGRRRPGGRPAHDARPLSAACGRRPPTCSRGRRRAASGPAPCGRPVGRRWPGARCGPRRGDDAPGGPVRPEPPGHLVPPRPAPDRRWAAPLDACADEPRPVAAVLRRCADDPGLRGPAGDALVEPAAAARRPGRRVRRPLRRRRARGARRRGRDGAGARGRPAARRPAVVRAARPVGHAR
nr:AI-2E family transporter [Angustibacter aerolatus]